MAARTASLASGPHDGERIVRPLEDPLPARLIAITFGDGATYARVGEHMEEETGEEVVLLRYDPGGSLTLAAKAAAGVDPDAPIRERG